jgi:urocanate hydratase
MPGMTAAAWQYIGSQGILQGTYETFMIAGRAHFGGSLSGRLIVTAGCGGMSGAQPLAGQLAGAAILVVEVDAKRIQRRIDVGYCQRITSSLDDALRWCRQAQDKGAAISVGLHANIADVLPELVRRNVVPDIVTDQTTCDPVRGYIPQRMTVDDVVALRAANPAELKARSLASLHEHVTAMLALKRLGSLVFEYGNNLRKHALEAGVSDAFSLGSFVDMFIRPLFCTGVGPFRWLAVSGEPQDIYRIDDLVLSLFPAEHAICAWIRTAREHVQFTGLPARIGWLGYEERKTLSLAVNRMVATGELCGPVAFTRDHLDSGSATLPHRETENMADGSDAISDWPLLNALLNCASGADLVAIHGMGNWAQSAGVTTIADGSDDAAQRLARVMNNDTAIGILRHADAGYALAQEAAASHQLGLHPHL